MLDNLGGVIAVWAVAMLAVGFSAFRGWLPAWAFPAFHAASFCSLLVYVGLRAAWLQMSPRPHWRKRIKRPRVNPSSGVSAPDGNGVRRRAP